MPTAGASTWWTAWWLLGIVIVGGIVFLTAAQWLAGAIARSSGALRSGPRGTIRMVIYYAGQLLALALLVRVIASWVGAGRHRRWMRPFYALTDWIVEPLRRLIPPSGCSTSARWSRGSWCSS